MKNYSTIFSRLQENTMCEGYYKASRTLIVLGDLRARGSSDAAEYQFRLARAAEVASRFCTAETCGYVNNLHINNLANEIMTKIPDFPLATGSGSTIVDIK